MHSVGGRNYGIYNPFRPDTEQPVTVVVNYFGNYVRDHTYRYVDWTNVRPFVDDLLFVRT